MHVAKDFLGKLLHSSKEQKGSQQIGGSERQGRMKQRQLDEQPTRRSKYPKHITHVRTCSKMHIIVCKLY